MPTANTTTKDIYSNLGVRKVVNAAGNSTVIGGSRLSPGVRKAMEEANRSYVWMEDLLESSGRIIAGVLKAEAAYVTCGCAAALMLATAACLAGKDPYVTRKLPDSRDMKNQILIQKAARGKYDRCVTSVGAQLIEVGTGGDNPSTTVEQLEEAVGPETAAIHYLAGAESRAGVLSLDDVVRIAHERGVPVIVDAAPMVFPLDRMLRYPVSGADLVCYGAKYFGSPNSTGILCGRKDLVAAAAFHGFIGFEVQSSQSIGRALKVDRQEVIAVVTALKEWFAADHDARLSAIHDRAEFLRRAIDGLPGIKVTAIRTDGEKSSGVIVKPGEGKTAEELVDALWNGNPRIRVNTSEGKLWFSTNTPTEEEVRFIAARLKEILQPK